MRSRSIIAAFVLGALFGPAAAGASDTATKDYRVAVGELAVTCSADTGVGGACFALTGSEKALSVVLADATGKSVAASVGLTGPAGLDFGTTRFCGASASINIPSGANRATVRVYSPADMTTCAGNGNAGPATVGTITVSYSH